MGAAFVDTWQDPLGSWWIQNVKEKIYFQLMYLIMLLFREEVKIGQQLFELLCLPYDCCSILAAASWLQHLGCSTLAAASWLQRLGYRILAAASWLQHLGCSFLATASWLQLLGYSILATASWLHNLG